MTADGRLHSLDILRGVAVAGMICVNVPGPSPGYTFMQHMPWHGWTAADLIFPVFLFAVGTAIPFAYGGALEREEPRRALAWKAAKRALLLIALGLPFGVPLDPESSFRIPGTLQRIGLCYLAAALLYINARTRTIAAAGVSLLTAYWLLLTFVPVPGFGPGDLSPQGNLAFFIDRTVLGAHRTTEVYDAEGLLSTLPAAATAIFGVLAGIWLRSGLSPEAKAAGLAAAGAAGVVLGLTWGRWHPLNKHIYTSSFAVFACGAAASLLAVFYWLADIRGRRACTRPFETFGEHALLAYCAASLGEAALDWAGLRLVPRVRLFGFLEPRNATLAWSLSWTLLWFAAVRAWVKLRRAPQP